MNGSAETAQTFAEGSPFIDADMGTPGDTCQANNDGSGFYPGPIVVDSATGAGYFTTTDSYQLQINEAVPTGSAYETNLVYTALAN